MDSEADPSYNPDKNKTKLPSTTMTIERLNELVSLLPDTQQENEAFVALLRGQVLNATKPDKHLRRWDAR